MQTKGNYHWKYKYSLGQRVQRVVMGLCLGVTHAHILLATPFYRGSLRIIIPYFI